MLIASFQVAGDIKFIDKLRIVDDARSTPVNFFATLGFATASQRLSQAVAIKPSTTSSGDHLSSFLLL